MLFEDDPRDIRKKNFIARMKRRKSAELLDPLYDKIAAWRGGGLEPEEVFKAAGYVGKKGEALIADFKKRPDVILAGIAMDENRYITSIGEIGIEVRLADITEVFSDAVVSPVDPDGGMTSGAAAAISEAGGAAVSEEVAERAPIMAGAAVSTGPGELTTGNVIHAAVRDVSGTITAVSVGAALDAALAEAESLETETLAIPGLGFVDGGIGADDAAAAVVAALERHKAESVAKALLVDVSEEMVSAFVSELEKRDED